MFDASQIHQIAECRIPFQMVYDNFEKRNIDADGQHYEDYYPRYEQSVLKAFLTTYDRFKLLPVGDGRNCYAFETDDGKFLNLKMEPTKGSYWKNPFKYSGKNRSQRTQRIGNEFAVSEQASSLTPNFLFSLLPQPDGRVAMRSNQAPMEISFGCIIQKIL